MKISHWIHLMNKRWVFPCKETWARHFSKQPLLSTGRAIRLWLQICAWSREDLSSAASWCADSPHACWADGAALWSSWVSDPEVCTSCPVENIKTKIIQPNHHFLISLNRWKKELCGAYLSKIQNTKLVSAEWGAASRPYLLSTIIIWCLGRKDVQKDLYVQQWSVLTHEDVTAAFIQLMFWKFLLSLWFYKCFLRKLMNTSLLCLNVRAAEPAPVLIFRTFKSAHTH